MIKRHNVNYVILLLATSAVVFALGRRKGNSPGISLVLSVASEFDFYSNLPSDFC